MESRRQAYGCSGVLTNGLLWGRGGAVGVGDTADAGRAIATSLDQTLVTLLPLVDDLGRSSGHLVSPDGRIDVSVGGEAVPALRQAQPGIDQALAALQGPRSAAGCPPRAARRLEYPDQLTGLQSALSTALTFGEIEGNCWEIRPRSVTSWRSCPPAQPGAPVASSATRSSHPRTAVSITPSAATPTCRT